MATQKIKDQLPDLAWQVVRHHDAGRFDDLAMAMRTLADYLNDQLADKVRAGLSSEKLKKIFDKTLVADNLEDTDKYINVRENRSVWVRKINPKYKQSLADSIKTLTIDEFVKFTDKPIKFTNSKHKLKIN